MVNIYLIGISPLYLFIGETNVVIRNNNADNFTSLSLLIKIQEMAQLEY